MYRDCPNCKHGNEDFLTPGATCSVCIKSDTITVNEIEQPKFWEQNL